MTVIACGQQLSALNELCFDVKGAKHLARMLFIILPKTCHLELLVEERRAFSHNNPTEA